MLNADRRLSFRESVELRLSPTNPMFHSPDRPSTLSLDLKNVDELVVRIYEMNVPAYYRSNRKPLDTDIDLDGLVATHETKHPFNQPAVRRHREQIELPQISGRGIWVVDLIGTGVRARAMIRRGSIDHVVTTVADGLAFTVIDENRKPVSGASIWVGSQEFSADVESSDNPRIVVPMGSADTTRHAVISDGVLAEAISMAQPRETYELDAAMHLDRTLLLSGAETVILIRPRLSMSGAAVDPSMIDDVRVQITSTDLDGITTTQESTDIKLGQGGELAVNYRVPARLAKVNAVLSGSVKPLSDSETRSISTSHSWDVAGVRKTLTVHDSFLTRDGGDYVVEVRGRNGERVPGAVVSLSISTIYRDAPVIITQQAGEDGRVRLGDMIGAEEITYSVVGGISHRYRPSDASVEWPVEIYTAIGKSIELPWLEKLDKPSSRFRLVATDDRTVRSDESDHLSIADGLLSITDLPAGDFTLIDLETNQLTKISVVDGPVIDDVVVGQTRHRSMNIARPISIARIDRKDGAMTIQLSGQTDLARVHVYAARYLDDIDPAASLELPMPSLTGRSISRAGPDT